MIPGPLLKIRTTSHQPKPLFWPQRIVALIFLQVPVRNNTAADWSSSYRLYGPYGHYMLIALQKHHLLRLTVILCMFLGSVVNIKTTFS